MPAAFDKLGVSGCMLESSRSKSLMARHSNQKSIFLTSIV